MKALVVVGHPAPGSFCRALADRIRERWSVAGCEVRFHDLVILRYCGVRHVMRALFGVVATSSDDERRRWLAEVTTLTDKAVELAA